jgi:hypothetical protein
MRIETPSLVELYEVYFESETHHHSFAEGKKLYRDHAIPPNFLSSSPQQSSL